MSAETLQFKTELKQILNIIIHSLYSHKDIFLRELISNSSDAIDRVRFESLTHHDLLEENADWKIKLIPDEKAGTLTISDNGCGMSKEALVENLGTIAKSGTRAFIENLAKADAKERPELIGQFGVGFYSAFMAADKVSVISRPAGGPAVKWESDGEGEFSISDAEKATRGTDVVLHLREDSKDFLDQWRLREIVKKYSDFVEHPIVMDVEKEDEKKNKTVAEETLNSRKALWLKRKNEVAEGEYAEFYKQLSRDFDDPLRSIHFSAEGTTEFRALLYLPKRKPVDFLWGEGHKGLQLYIKRVFILDDGEALMPRYLRFVKGVVDSSDLPLNVSRELLQQSPLLEKIKNNLVNKVLGTLEDLKTKNYDEYVGFYKEFGQTIKEGVSIDWANREKIADLLLFESTKTEPGKYTTLGKYVEALPADDKTIYYLIGENREMLENSPHLEALKAKDREVLLLTDPFDEFFVQALREYKDAKLQAADKGAPKDEKPDEKQEAEFKDFLRFLAGRMGEVKDVRLSTRLKNSAACLVTDEGEMSPHLERLMRRMGREETPETKRVLELNAAHPAVQALQKLFAKDATDARLEKYGRLLYDEAVIAEGSRVKDPAAFAQRLNELLVERLG